MLATLFVAMARSASAQQTGNCKATKQWQLEQVEKDHIKLTGQVEIDCGNESMSADQVEIFQDTNVMIATGKSKAKCVERMTRGPLETRMPASLLQLHRDVELVLDRAAASVLRPEER